MGAHIGLTSPRNRGGVAGLPLLSGVRAWLEASWVKTGTTVGREVRRYRSCHTLGDYIESGCGRTRILAHPPGRTANASSAANRCGTYIRTKSAGCPRMSGLVEIDAIDRDPVRGGNIRRSRHDNVLAMSRRGVCLEMPRAAAHPATSHRQDSATRGRAHSPHDSAIHRLPGGVAHLADSRRCAYRALRGRE